MAKRAAKKIRKTISVRPVKVRDRTTKKFVRVWNVYLGRDRITSWTNRADAVSNAASMANEYKQMGINIELFVYKLNGQIGERRTYGNDPKRSKG